MMVKICGITNREDAEAAADAGASAIGLNFYRHSPRYVSPTGAAMIVDKIPAGVLKVGVFVDEHPDVIARIALQTGLDVAQLHGDSSCSTLPVWRSLPIREAVEVSWFADDEAEAFLLDTAFGDLHGGTGKTFRWSLAREAGELTSKKIIVAGGLDEINVQQAIEEARPWGVDVCSRIESEPGRKDRDKMRKFIQAALASKL
jgi:phosphoribosylanthranilate isomerase